MKKWHAIVIITAVGLLACGVEDAVQPDEPSPASTTTASSPLELLKNGGLEDGLSPFEPELGGYADAKVEQDCSAASAGKCSLKVTPATVCSNPDQYYKVQAKQVLTGLKGGQKCVLSFRVKSANERSGAASLVVEVKSDVSHTSADGMLWQQVPTGTGWETKTLEFNSKDVPQPVRVSWNACAGKSVVSLDEISLKCVTQ